MASHFVFYDGASTDESDWGTWATAAGIDRTSSTNCYDSLAEADSSVSAGDTVYVAHDHYKDYGAVNTTITLPSCRVLVVNRTTGNLAEHTTTSQGDGIFTGTNSLYLSAADESCVFIHGLRFGATYRVYITGDDSRFLLNKCTFASYYNSCTQLCIGSSPAYQGIWVTFINSTFDYSQSNNATSVPIFNAICDASHLEIIRPTIVPTSGTFSPTLYAAYTSYAGTSYFYMSCADVSASSQLADTGATKNGNAHIVLEDCKIPDIASWTIFDKSYPNVRATFRRCSHSSISTPNTRDFYEECNGHKCQTDNANSRSGADGASGNTYSIKLSTSASATYANYARLNQRLAVWHDGSGSKTLTVHMGSGDSGLYDDDVFAIVTYPDTAATAYQQAECISTFPASARAAAGTSTYLDNDNETSEWVEGSGVTTTYQFKVSGLNPTVPGYVYVDIFVTKPSINVWVDPAITLT